MNLLSVAKHRLKDEIDCSSVKRYDEESNENHLLAYFQQGKLFFRSLKLGEALRLIKIQ